jgi:hypothetical protein
MSDLREVRCGRRCSAGGAVTVSDSATPMNAPDRADVRRNAVINENLAWTVSGDGGQIWG